MTANAIKDHKEAADKTIKCILKDESGTKLRMREVMWFS